MCVLRRRLLVQDVVHTAVGEQGPSGVQHYRRRRSVMMASLVMEMGLTGCQEAWEQVV